MGDHESATRVLVDEDVCRNDGLCAQVSPTPQTDCDCVMYPMMLMAHALGLGTCWNGFLSKAASGFRLEGFTALREMLEVPDHHDVYAAATLGSPRFRLHSVPQRESRVHWVGS